MNANDLETTEQIISQVLTFNRSIFLNSLYEFGNIMTVNTQQQTCKQIQFFKRYSQFPRGRYFSPVGLVLSFSEAFSIFSLWLNCFMFLFAKYSESQIK